jgi:hypothetical protein
VASKTDTDTLGFFLGDGIRCEQRNLVGLLITTMPTRGTKELAMVTQCLTGAKWSEIPSPTVEHRTTPDYKPRQQLTQYTNGTDFLAASLPIMADTHDG